MTDDRERWALILGASSGMGEATAIALARPATTSAGSTSTSGRRSPTSRRSRRRSRPRVQALYINMNAADDEKRAAALATLRERFDRLRGGGPPCPTSAS